MLWFTLWLTNSSLLKMAIEIVDLPSCKMVDLSSEHLPEGNRY